eukprot:TRINITY_DN3172_c0_g1_i1.p1 TRINITY_DN3172_c0_g1~~TRINITY_DN3172_c0_g1_i1.p1  ORF type:complete len:232 (+),score=43.65 TRINITY_DN3172_c0_g1_i1:336-1031(+)
MVVQHLARLRTKRIVLASGSPRRKELLEQLGLSFDVVPSTFAENLDKSLFQDTPWEYPVETAYRKGCEVVQRIGEANFDVLISADTVVVEGGTKRILEKPRDHADAKETLSRLSGRTHHVYTGVVLFYSSRHGEATATDIGTSTSTGGTAPTVTHERFHVDTEVEFDALTEDVIDAYVATDEPLGVAGSFRIQGKGSVLVRSVNGCFYNVVGLPLNAVGRHLCDAVERGAV